jgi:hypothetical protein
MRTGREISVAEAALQTWLEVLHECGVPLAWYGEKEAKKVSRDNPHINSIEYGPEVRDWKIWWSEPTDRFVGDFWRLVEPKPSVMPGSWVEEEEGESADEDSESEDEVDESGDKDDGSDEGRDEWYLEFPMKPKVRWFKFEPRI